MKTLSILFIRSVPLPLALQSLRALRQVYPEARLTVLSGPASVSSLESEHVVDRIIPYRGSRFGIFAAGPKCLLQLRTERFDYVLVPFTGADSLPFWNVGRMALMLAGGAVVWLACDDLGTGVDLKTCRHVSWREMWQRTSSMSGIRRTSLKILKWPFLCLFYAVAMPLLTMLAAVLLPLVWFKPTADDDRHI
jgi:hypothetical protein